MSADVTETETFDLSADEVFGYVVDFANLSEWDPMFDRSRRLDDGPIRVGSQFEVVAEMGDREVPIVYTVEEYDEPRHAKLVGSADGFTSIDTLDVETVDGGAQLTWHATVDADMPLVDTAATPVFKGVAKASMAGLRSQLD